MELKKLFHRHDFYIIERRARAIYSKRESAVDRREYDGELIGCECGKVMFRAKGKGLLPVEVVKA